MHKLIAQGAEAKLFEENGTIIKDRIKKPYRIKEIDDKLRGFRTRREAKILEKLKSINFPAPKLIKSDNKEKIIIEKIEGDLLKNILEANYKNFAVEIGKDIATLHNNSIVHGDLTTSNMIFNNKNKKIYFIDFGLSFFSDKSEDRAVDLHVLKEGLAAKHNKICNDGFNIILEQYKKNAKNSNETLKRLDAVEKRGRYRGKRGS